MRPQTIQVCCTLLLALSLGLSLTTLVQASAQNIVKRTAQKPLMAKNQLVDFPAVDPNYIYDQLDYMGTHFQKREAGYDTNLPANQNGHDEFADYWAKELVNNLQGFGAQVLRDSFTIKGWKNRPAPLPAYNVEVTIPGATHAEQVVIIGCHYDGMAFSSQSANDDTSGCAIELGVAKAMGNYWRTHQSYPTRTLRFVIFDAEEQGLYGSYHYTNSTVNGDINNIVAMFNEEQSGIAYPLRYLGQLKNPLLPLNIDLSPLQNTELYPQQDKLSTTQRANITRFRTLMQQAIPLVFQQFQTLGYAGLTYHDEHKQDIPQPIFSADQTKNVKAEDDLLGASDQMPFTQAGLPCATFAGNSSYYDQKPPAWSYPYDQPEDTIQLMNTFADGNSNRSNALTLALALPGMLTTWMLSQPDILGQTESTMLAKGTPITTISDLGQTQVNQDITVNAKASFDPQNASSNLGYAWDFGDGNKATGIEATHHYTATGNYTLTLTTSTATGTAHVNKTIKAATDSINYGNIYAQYPPSSGKPRANPEVTLPQPDTTLSDKVLAEPVSDKVRPIPTLPGSQTGSIIPTFTPIIAVVLALVITILATGRFLWRKKGGDKIAQK